jgi:GDP-4-dehydro-6-deoxy-D-mannose reductase
MSSAPSIRVLVTGQTGFVGNHFTNHLGTANVVAFPDSIDLVNFEKCRTFVRDQTFDAVLHLAARSSVAESLSNPQLTKDVNVEGTRNLLRSLVEKKFAGKVLLVSSGEVYGAVDEENLPVKESTPTAPRNPYAESKVAMEQLVLGSDGEFADASFAATIARPFNHIGPGQAEHFIVANFTAQLARRKLGRESGPIKAGDLSITRDFTDVRDVVAAYSKLLERGVRGEIYNLGSGVETKLRSMLETLIEISGTETKFETDPARLRAGEQMRMCADISKIHAAVGWRPRINMTETLIDCFTAALAKEKDSERIGT